MKKTLIVTAIILITVSVGVGIFVVTFNIAPYKGLIVSQLERMTGNKVEIGRLSVKAQKGGALLEVENFKIYTEEGGNQTVLLSFERLEALVELVPLLVRSLRVTWMSVNRPEILIIKSKDRPLNLAGYGQAAGTAATPAGPAAFAAKAFGIYAGSIEIREGTLRFQDMSSDQGSDITARKIDATIHNVSRGGPVQFTAKMAVASAGQNLSLSGTAGGFVSDSPFIRDLDIEAALAGLDQAELKNAVPVFAKPVFNPELAGILKVKVRELELSKGKVSKFSAEASLADGRISVPPLRVPMDRINLSATAERDSITVASFSASVATGTLSGSGRFDDIFGGLRTTLRATVEVQGIKEFIFSILEQKQSMDGNTRLTFEGTMTGLSWPEISRTLAGGGEFYLDRGMMMNTNILNQTLGSLTLFPGLSDMVRGYVPVPIQQAFGDSNTVIEPLRQAYTIEGGYVMIPDLSLKTDTFEMRGEAKSSFTGDISGSGMIRFAQSVSAAMLKAVPEMRYMADSQGMVEFPMAFKSGVNGFKVIPDLKYVGRKVAVQKAGEIVNDFIQKAVNGSAQPGSAGNSPEAPAKAPKLKDLVKSFMEEQRRSSQ